MQDNTLTISNILIIIAALFTLLSYIYPNIYIFGLNSYFLDTGNYPLFLVQIFSSQFLHGGIFHLAMNAIFILYFGNILEREMGGSNFFLFFSIFCFFNAAFLLVFSSGNTVGISGFALALLTYLTLLLWQRGNPEYSGGATAIVINILIGLSPGISFAGHFAGMVFGGLWWGMSRLSNKKSKL